MKVTHKCKMKVTHQCKDWAEEGPEQSSDFTEPVDERLVLEPKHEDQIITETVNS